MTPRNTAYENAYGTWEVNTEGDCEGRTTSRLGTFEGYLDEIAFMLASKSYYSLNFKAVSTKKLTPKTGVEVSIQLDIDSGTWDMSSDKRVEFVKKMLAGRNVTVERGQYYASVMLHDGNSPEERDRKAKEARRLQALSKLSREDRDALGLEG